jgi:hypothetical protein
MTFLYKKYTFFLINQVKMNGLFLRQRASLATISSNSVARKTLTCIGLLLIATHFTACEKVITLDLNAADRKYVVEAEISDKANSCSVILTQTKNFDDNNTFDGVSNAEVTVTDNNGAPIKLNQTTPGVYEASALKGIPGHTYQLTVKVDGQTFAATSTMPALVPFDSLYITERTFFDETNKYATLAYTDPVGRGNAYRYIQYVNGVKEKTIFVRDDDLTDGRPIERALFFFSDDNEEDEKKLKTGDSVRVDLLTIDYNIYKYWYSLAQSSTGENQSATPGNPITNITGGALGYFSAHTIQSKSIVVR